MLTSSAASANAATQPELRTFTLDQVAWHDSPNDCWIVVYDRVYDVTSFLWAHPGGAEILLEYAGRDASLAFQGAGHSAAALLALRSCLVGQLPDNERLFDTDANAGKAKGKLPIAPEAAAVLAMS